MTSLRRTAPAARTRRRSQPCWLGVCPYRRRPAARPGRWSRACPSSAPVTARSTFWGSVQLGDLGELGLLAELERRGLAVRIENDAATLDDGVVVTQDALVEGVHFRLEWISWRDL